MTDISFHFNVSDKLLYTCRLVRKAVSGGSRVVVTGARDTLQELDQLLWTFSSTEFLPHCNGQSGPPFLQRSPLLLAESLQSVPFSNVLLNLGSQIPDGFGRFGRVIEIVGKHDEDRLFARQRWKQYSASGFDLMGHDLEQRATL